MENLELQYELESNFGAGETIINVLTGEKYTIPGKKQKEILTEEQNIKECMEAIEMTTKKTTTIIEEEIATPVVPVPECVPVPNPVPSMVDLVPTSEPTPIPEIKPAPTVQLLDAEEKVVKEFPTEKDAYKYCLDEKIATVTWAKESLRHNRKMYYTVEGKKTAPRSFTGVGFKLVYKTA